MSSIACLNFESFKENQTGEMIWLKLHYYYTKFLSKFNSLASLPLEMKNDCQLLIDELPRGSIISPYSMLGAQEISIG